MNLFFDIETIPADESLRDTAVDAELKKIAKRQETTEETQKSSKNRETIYRSTSLSGDFGRIFCVGYALGDKDVEIIKGDEVDILEKWWEIANSADCFIGHNIMDFDLPFIYKRSIVRKIKPTAKHLNLSFARYRSFPIYDTMREWEKWNPMRSISLDKLAKVLGLPSSKDGGIDGSQVYDAYLSGRQKEIYEYCKRDVELTRKVYKRMNFED